MCEDGCANCEALEAENEALRAEIQRLRRQLEAIRRYCNLILERTRRILGQRSGVPRGKWSFARGADGVADSVEKLTH